MAPAKCLLVTVFCCQLPAEPASLQLSFSVAAVRAIHVSAASAHFYHNPFASRTWAQLPASFRFRLPISFPFPLADQFSVSALPAGFRPSAAAAAARGPHHFSKKSNPSPTFFKKYSNPTCVF
ncbi:hypothetical protein [Methanimicrococcus hongohii]|uniref:hypothetical protein n=1 Tax=Methanimicrococcus hongohii TaxID=3028295 RepID=UPI00292F3DF3|nr:hypothetical protein [Methanimicrococcus sp. Hf6]